MVKYRVIVGNIGTIFTGDSYESASSDYAFYVKLSKSNRGRAGGEGVTLIEDGEIILEHIGNSQE